MVDSPPWLTVEDVVAIHDGQIRRFGGLSGIKSMALLESAVAAPLNLFYYGREPGVLKLGAHLAQALVRNHPFLDGNKRTAAVALLEFLYLNSLTIDLPDTVAAQPLAELIEQLAGNTIDAVQLADALHPHLIAA